MSYTIDMSTMTCVRLTDDLAAAVAKLHRRDGIPASEQIRRALRPWLKAKGVLKEKKEKR